MAGDPEVEHEAVDGIHPDLGQGGGDGGEVPLEDADPVAELREALPGHRDRLGVPVEADEPPLRGARGEDESGVACATEGPVHVHPTGFRFEEPEHLVREDRYVMKI